jgi:subtilisin family serine protease
MTFGRGAPGAVRGLVAAVAAVATVVALLAVAPPEPGSAAARVDDDIQPKLLQTLEDRDRAPFWVRFEDRADLAAPSRISDWDQRGRAVHAALKRTARTSQAGVIATLEAARVEYTPFWVSNAVYVHGASLELAELLAADREVSELLAPASYRIPAPAKSSSEDEIDSVEWNVAAIGADDVWSEFGTGSGIVVANIDSGAEYTHPALVERYRGNTGDGFEHDYNWYDPSRICPSPAPCDNNQHGTHTMGTMVGDDGGGNQIGVAPGARWIAAKGCESSSCSAFAMVSTGQWMVAPTDLADQNPRPDLRPHVVNNSWSVANGGEENPFYDDILAAWRAAGIFPAFANGNAGPSCDSAGSPGDSLASYSVGAYDVDGDIASFSSRGPGAAGEPKPNLSAPGVAVRSSVLNGSYGTFNGTSMATPHVAATVALVWSSAPTLKGDVGGTEALLDQTAQDAENTTCGGTAGDNNVYGEGRLNAYAAARAAADGPAGTLRGTLTDAATGEPIADGRITAVAGASTRAARTREDGSYTIRALPGEYELAATAYSYEDGSATATVSTGETTVVDFRLEPAPEYVLEGEVVEQETGKPVAGTTLTLAGTPLSTTSDGSGRYRFARVPVGDYTLTAAPTEADLCLAVSRRDVSVRQDTTAQVEVAQVRDHYGYTCTLEPTTYIEADDDPIPFEADTDPTQLNDIQMAVVRIPFAIDLYDRSYSAPVRATVTDNGTVMLNGFVEALYQSAFTFVEGSQVATATRGEAPNRTFTIEWRDMALELNHSVLFDFEVTFHEGGDIVMGFGDRDRPQTGRFGLRPSNAESLSPLIFETPPADGRQVRFIPPRHGIVSGMVTDANDGRPVADAPIRITDATGAKVLHHLDTDADGRYRARLFPGDYDLSVGGHGYEPQTTAITIAERRTEVVDAALSSGILDTGSDAVHVAVDGSGEGRTELALTNRGAADLTWRAAEVPAPLPPGGAGERLDTWTYPPGTFLLAGGAAEAAGGKLWLSGIAIEEGRLRYTLREFNADGTPTGTAYEPAVEWGLPLTTNLLELTHVPASDSICVLAIEDPFQESDLAQVHCLDPATGDLEQTLDVGALPAGAGANGLAYDEADDVFYVVGDILGGMHGGGRPRHTGYIATVAGLRRAHPGQVLSICNVDHQLGGAEYNPTSRTVWAGDDQDPYPHFEEGSTDDGFVQFDPRTCEQVSRFAHHTTPDIAPTWTTGLGIDASGNLWATSGLFFATGYIGVLRYGSGDPIEVERAQLAFSKDDGVLARGESTVLSVVADGAAAGGDAPAATLRLMSNAARDWDVRVPVFLHTFDGLRRMLDELVQAGQVRRGKERQLQHSIDRAELLSARGDDRAANGQLQTFSRQVDAFTPRFVDPAAAERLQTETTFLRQE